MNFYIVVIKSKNRKTTVTMAIHAIDEEAARTTALSAYIGWTVELVRPKTEAARIIIHAKYNELIEERFLT